MHLRLDEIFFLLRQIFKSQKRLSCKKILLFVQEGFLPNAFAKVIAACLFAM